MIDGSSASAPLTAAALAERLGARVVAGDGGRLVCGVCGNTALQAGALTYLTAAPADAAALAVLGAVLVPPGLTLAADVPHLECATPRLAFAQALAYYHPEEVPPAGVHPTAVVAPDAQLGADVSIGPHASIGSGAVLGDGVIVGDGAVVGNGVVIGAGTRLFPRVVIYPRCTLGARVRVHAGTVIGSDGFGYEWDGTRHAKIPQVGGVSIEDDVELGANVTVDNGVVGATVIRRGTKIDNLVHIAHNVDIGEHCLLISQVGVAGSARVGAGCVLGGQVGVAGHLTIGPRATIAAKSGVSKSVPGNAVYSGFPLRRHEEEKKIKAALGRLPQLLRRVARLEQRHDGGNED